MNPLLAAGLLCSTALLPLMYFLMRGIQALLAVGRRKEGSAESRARIRQVQILNEQGRRIPFVKLKVDVYGRNGETMRADAEGFYRPEELSRLQPGAVIRVKSRAGVMAALQIVKDSACTGRKTKEQNEFIAATTSPVQSRAARNRRLVFQ